MPLKVQLVDHPLAQHKLTAMRRKETSVQQFRQLLEEIGMLMAYEVTRGFPLSTERIETPLCSMDAPVMEGKKVVLVSILRAGDGMLAGFLRVIPSARVGHIGLYRNEETLEPVEYYFKLPAELGDRDVLILDPMLATGNSASAAIQRIKALRPRSLRMVSLLAAPEGLERLGREHPDVPVCCVAVDQRLNESGYIVPGLGDAGDRMFGTK